VSALRRLGLLTESLTYVDDCVPVLRASVLDETLGGLDRGQRPSTGDDEALKLAQEMSSPSVLPLAGVSN
jgi:hypothetical protein